MTNCWLTNHQQTNKRETVIYRTLVGAANWLQTQTRPDLSGRATSLQGCLPQPAWSDMQELVGLVEDTASTCEVQIRILPIHLEDLRFAVATDSAWANAKGNKSQAAWMVFATNPDLFENREAPMSIIALGLHIDPSGQCNQGCQT